MTELQKGWGPLPGSFKTIFVLGCIGIFSGILGLIMNSTSVTVVFGQIVQGTPAIIISAVVGVLIPFLVLYAFWERESWGWELTLALYALALINQIMALSTYADVIPLMLANQPQVTPDMYPMQISIAKISSYFSMALFALFGYFVYVNKKFFKN